MQRQSARSFLEEVLAKVEGLEPSVRAALLDAVDDKPGAKRAAKLATILRGDGDGGGDGGDGGKGSSGA